MVRVFIVCGAGVSSTFLSMRLRSLAQNSKWQLNFSPSALETLRAGEGDVVVVASHIAEHVDVTSLGKVGVHVIRLGAKDAISSQAESVLGQISDHLQNQSG